MSSTRSTVGQHALQVRPGGGRRLPDAVTDLDHAYIIAV
jgi:hypothetical protein